MSAKNSSKKNSKNTESTSTSSNETITPYCNDGLIYWIHNAAHDCISYGKISENEPDYVEIIEKPQRKKKT